MFRVLSVLALACLITSCGTNPPAPVKIYNTGRAPADKPVIGKSKSTFSNKYVSGYHINKAISCVPYTRDVSGIPIRGNAHTWWPQAKGKYGRGSKPKKGAVFVLSKSSRLKYGHVSVVTRILSDRTIEVTHSNWGRTKAERAMIYERMLVQDVSPKGDWSRARFWNYHTNAFGSPYIASGFIYP